MVRLPRERAAARWDRGRGRSQRHARWKSLDSISQFGWCGSAALGGWLADKYSYGFTFYITAAVQGAAIVMQSALIFIVPRSEAAAKPAAPAEETTIQ